MVTGDAIRYALLLTAMSTATAGAAEDRHHWSVELELEALSADDSLKLSPEPDSEFARIAFDYVGSITPTLAVHAVIDAVDSGTGGIDVTEAFLELRPVPRSPFRYQLRAGAFYPPLSLENSGPAWTSPYSESFSAINTWVGEELRTVGAEWRVGHSIGPRARQRDLQFIAATYYANDPAGALLSWRGWALHQRQSRLGDAIPLPVLPQIAPDMMFNRQALATEPFVETDHRPGYYYGLEFKLSSRARIIALHYDNHADPKSLKDGHYGWTTRFNHVGAQFELPAGLGLIVQWLDGTTAMGPVSPPAAEGYHVVDNGIASAFALLTKQHQRQRWTLRFDDFSVTDYDLIPLDNNDESGHAWTIGWQFEPDGNWLLGVDWQQLELTRPALAYAGLPIAYSENLLRLGIRYRLSPAVSSR
jgi:hypothetical protein